MLKEVTSSIGTIELKDYTDHEEYGKYMKLTDREHLLFYDIEVYPYDAFVIFKDLDGRTVANFHNDFKGIRELIAHSAIAGYNNYFYDDKVVTGMIDELTSYQLKSLNDDLIVRQQKKNISHIIESYDCFQQIDVARPSLKKIEANKGFSVEETPIDFNIPRSLTPEELEAAMFYCEYDVEQTREIFFERFVNYFMVKKMLVEMKPTLPKNAYRWNTTTIIANILLDKPTVRWSTIRVPEEMLEIVPRDVRKLWETKEKGKIIHQEFNNNITFGFGGVHGESTKKKKWKHVISLDVASLYPSIMINYKMLGSATEVFKEIYDERIRIKHTDHQRQLALKLILNSTYGLLKSEYSLLFNPKASTSICAIGQILMYDLQQRLYPTCEIVQSNTDSVTFVTNEEDYKRVWKEWEEEHNLTLEEERFDVMVQRDVNNYVALTDEGKIKTKGGDVSSYNTKPFTKPYVATIIDEAIVRHLIYEEEILDILLENLDKPIKFQYVLQAGGTFDGTFDKDDNEFQKVNRVFAGKEKNQDSVTLYKRKNGDTYARFPNAPEHMIVWNKDIKELENFQQIVDLNHYYDIIIHKLKKWK